MKRRLSVGLALAGAGAVAITTVTALPGQAISGGKITNGGSRTIYTCIGSAYPSDCTRQPLSSGQTRGGGSVDVDSFGIPNNCAAAAYNGYSGDLISSNVNNSFPYMGSVGGYKYYKINSGSWFKIRVTNCW